MDMALAGSIQISVGSDHHTSNQDILGGPTRIYSGTTQNSLLSPASTIKYAWCKHVPYAQFESQVIDLCHLLWPSSYTTDRDERLGGRIRRGLSGALGLKKPALPTISTQSSKGFVTEHLRGGGYNRVVGITAMESDQPDNRMLLRVPRGSWAKPEHDIIILQFVREFLRYVPVPEIISYDLTRNNPLVSPYVLQKRIPGLDLESKSRSYPDLTHEQKLKFVEKFCEVLMDLKGVEHAYAGRVDSRINDEGVNEFTVGPFPNDFESDELVAMRSAELPFFKVRKYEKTTPDAAVDSTSRPNHQTPFFFIMTQLGRNRRALLERSPHLVRTPHCVEDRLMDMAISLNNFGYLNSFQNEAHAFCLTHYDLEARNIMVDIKEDGSLKISGILDWDLAMFAPKWVHCRPPMWIWNWLNGGNEDQRKASETPPTKEQRELKQLWEDLVDCEYKFCAYAPEYRMARTLFRLTLSGVHDPDDFSIAMELLSEWEEYSKSDEWIKQGVKAETTSVEEPAVVTVQEGDGSTTIAEQPAGQIGAENTAEDKLGDKSEVLGESK